MNGISILLGFLLSFTNTTVAIILINIAINKDNNTFNKIILWSFVIRYFVVLFLIWLNLLIFQVDKLSFSLSFVTFTFIFIFLEIFYINFRSKLVNLHYRKGNK